MQADQRAAHLTRLAIAHRLVDATTTLLVQGFWHPMIGLGDSRGSLIDHR
jgi:hypothetical protein